MPAPPEMMWAFVPGRGICWQFVAMLVFSIMADYRQYQKKTEFIFVVVVAVVTWLISFIRLVHMLYANKVNVWNAWVDVALYGSLGVLMAIGFVTAAVECNKKDEEGTKFCKGESKPRAASAFSFLLSACLVWSTFLAARTVQRPSCQRTKEPIPSYNAAYDSNNDQELQLQPMSSL
eukprot:jgi/Mesvir1/19212/Mv11521-RA.1